ncbi:MAG: alpha-glucan phosphorylase, partial [Candidatus Omnitrophota bacterium]
WYEGYNGTNGWAIGNVINIPDPGEEDKADAEALYQLLEEEIVPLFYQHDYVGVPHAWMGKVKEAIGSIVPIFSTRRDFNRVRNRPYRG